MTIKVPVEVEELAGIIVPLELTLAERLPPLPNTEPPLILIEPAGGRNNEPLRKLAVLEVASVPSTVVLPPVCV